MLDPKTLMRRAQAATGLQDFGDGPFEDGLEVFCASLNREADLNAAGMAGAEAMILNSLSERLRVEDCLRKNPEILDQELAPQVFVLGLPRTGSTALSQFMSEDPAARSIRRWELSELTPPPDAAVQEDPRLARTRAAFEERYRKQPEMRAMLPVEAEDPSEHGPILGLTFRNLQLPTRFNCPTYRDWLLMADMVPAYQYLARVLKLLQWKTPAGYWNLKNPPDVFSIEAIHTVFPTATIVWTHRDPGKSIPSVASLANLIRSEGVDNVDKHVLMQYMLDFQSEGVRRGLAARTRLGEAVQIVDSTQAALARDTIGVIRDLYAKVGLPFTPEYEGHLKARMANRPRGQHGKHEYDLADYGVTPVQIRDRFQDYLDGVDILEPT